MSVSVPYEITLLSNVAVDIAASIAVSAPYEITLLSNITVCELRPAFAGLFIFPGLSLKMSSPQCRTN